MPFVTVSEAASPEHYTCDTDFDFDVYRHEDTHFLLIYPRVANENCQEQPRGFIVFEEPNKT